MNELINDNDKIENLIYEIRGKQVMLDSDLARLYECTNGTKTINQAVNRHLDRFPEDFYFQLTKEEYDNLKSQLGTSSLNKCNKEKYDSLKFQNGTSRLSSHGGVRKLPYVFTEQGIAMLASVLKTKVAAQTSVAIMRAFVIMKKYISNNLINNEIILNHENRLLKLETTFNKMQEKEEINTIFFEGQIFDAYTLLLDLFDKSQEEIIIIDNYAGKELLKILKNINKKILIISKNIDEVLVQKYNSQYSNITFKNIDIFHDRFIIIDRKELYSCGASFKDLGKKCFAINKIDSSEMLNNLLDRITN